MTADDIATELALFVHPDAFTEIRALNVGFPGRTFSGWFDGRHLRDMAREALALTRQASGVYFVPNPIDPQVAERRLNKVLDVHRGFRLTHDEDIIERRFLIVDFDPRRLTYDDRQDCPTSARELAFTRRLAKKCVRPLLEGVGFLDPIVMLSGNGIHYVYPTSPTPSRDCSKTDPLAKLLRYLKDRFETFTVAIDSNTHNPCRMLKVPGTFSRKGEQSHDRPHRVARIIEVPHGWIQPEPPPAVERRPAEREPEPARKPEPAAKAPARSGSVPRQVQPGVGHRAAGARAGQQADLFDARPGGDGTPVH